MEEKRSRQAGSKGMKKDRKVGQRQKMRKEGVRVGSSRMLGNDKLSHESEVLGQGVRLAKCKDRV